MAISHTYYPKGVCARQIDVTVEGGAIKNVRITGGCDGYSHAMERLLVGLDARQVISRLKGVGCEGRPTSCSDQTARALEELLAQLPED